VFLYNPDLQRFVNADILIGDVTDFATLNRYAYANGNPVSNVDPFGLSADDRGKTTKEKYINSYMENTNNELYKLLQSWGISLTKTTYETSNIIDAFWGGIKVNLYVDVSFQTSTDANVKTDISLDSKSILNEATTPNLKIPLTEIDIKGGVYTDENRMSVGASAYVSKDGWTLSNKYQTGLYSDARIISLSYEPNDVNLPVVSVTIDSEMMHWLKVATAGVIVATVYAPETLATTIPNAVDFIQQLSNISLAFSN